MKIILQEIKFGDSCFRQVGSLYHEILHALGLIHEHSRNDRDLYVSIQWQNIPDTGKKPKISIQAIIFDTTKLNSCEIYLFSFSFKISVEDINFQKYTGAFWEETYGLDTPYDFKSVMHYPIPENRPHCGYIIVKKVCFVTFSYLFKITEKFFFFCLACV